MIESYRNFVAANHRVKPSAGPVTSNPNPREQPAAAYPERYASVKATIAALIGIWLPSACLAQATEAPELLHAFVAAEAPVGYLFGVREGDRPDAFSMMEIRSSTADKYRVLYRVTRTGLYLANGKLDAEIHDDGSRGFFLAVQRPTYVTLECCRLRTPDNGAMDPMTITWNPDEKRFELQKAP